MHYRPHRILNVNNFRAIRPTNTWNECPSKILIPTDNTKLLRIHYSQLVIDDDDALRMLRERNILKKSMQCPGKGGLEMPKHHGWALAQKIADTSGLAHDVLAVKSYHCAQDVPFSIPSQTILLKSLIFLLRRYLKSRHSRTHTGNRTRLDVSKRLVQPFKRQQSISPESLRRGSLPQTLLSGM